MNLLFFLIFLFSCSSSNDLKPFTKFDLKNYSIYGQYKYNINNDCWALIELKDDSTYQCSYYDGKNISKTTNEKYIVNLNSKNEYYILFYNFKPEFWERDINLPNVSFSKYKNISASYNIYIFNNQQLIIPLDFDHNIIYEKILKNDK